MWSKNISSSKLKQFSIPCLLNEALLLTVNHSAGKIEIIEFNSGKNKNELALPEHINCPDLGRSYQLVNDKVTFASENGKIYSLSEDFSHLDCETLSVDHMSTNLPFFEGDNIGFEDESGHFVFYSRSKNRILWKRKFENNLNFNMYACRLTAQYYLIAGSLGQLSVVNKDGKKFNYIKSERRITTQVTKINDFIIYANKSEVKVLRFNSSG